MKEFPAIPGHKIIKRLGQGGMADVYLGVQEKLDRQVAIKVLSPHLFRDEQFSTRFIKEAQTAARLIHPNIITIHDVGDTPATGGAHLYYIVMEYLAESLSARIRRKGKLPVGEALVIIKMIASALDYAHRQGFIHRDIKPDNIMFRTDGTVVLVDFGIARAINSTTHLTRTGMSIGTPHYMSPEQCLGEKIDGRSDIYSLGVQLFELLTGDVPYRAENTAGVIIKHIQDPIPRLSGVLSRFQLIIDRLMAKKRDERPRDGREVITLIETQCADLLPSSQQSQAFLSPPEEVTRESVTMKTPRPHIPTTARTMVSPNKKGPLIGVLAALFAIVAVALGFVILKKDSTPVTIKPPVEKRMETNTPEKKKKDTDAPVPGDEKKPAVEPGKDSSEDKPNVTVPPPGERIDKEQYKLDVEYNTYLDLAQKDFEKGDYDRAMQSVREAAKRKKTPELENLEAKIRRARIARIQLLRKQKEEKTKLPKKVEEKPASDVINAMQLKTDLRVKYNAILKRLTMPAIHPDAATHGFIIVTIDISKIGRIVIRKIVDGNLTVQYKNGKELFRKAFKRALSSLQLDPPLDKAGKVVDLEKWRLTYKVGKFGEKILLTKQ